MKCKRPCSKIKNSKEQTPEMCLEAVKKWINFTICQRTDTRDLSRIC